MLQEIIFSFQTRAKALYEEVETDIFLTVTEPNHQSINRVKFRAKLGIMSNQFSPRTCFHVLETSVPGPYFVIKI